MSYCIFHLWGLNVLIRGNCAEFPKWGRCRCSSSSCPRCPQVSVSLSLCESAAEISGVRTIRAQPQQKGGSGQGNSFFLWPIVLPRFENTLPLFHPRLCAQRNRKCLHHRLHPSSAAKGAVTFIDFWLSLLSAPNMTDSHHYSWRCEHCHDNLPLLRVALSL